MSDDPTVTGPNEAEEAEPSGPNLPEDAEAVELPAGTNILVNGKPVSSGDEMAQHLRAIPGANITENSPFEFKWDCNLIYTVANNTLTIKLKITDPRSGETRDHSMNAVPIRDFGAPELLNIYLADVKRNYFDVLRERLTHEAFLLMEDVCRGLFGIIDPGAESHTDIIENHLKQTKAALDALLANMPETQRAGGWSKIALRNAVASAAFRLTQRGVTGRALTLAAVRAEMHAEYGNNAPASGEALRKQLEERDLNWRPIKADVERFAAEVKRRREAEADRPAEPPVSPGAVESETGG